MVDLIFFKYLVKDKVMIYKKWIGIDVSKDKLDISIFDGNSHSALQILNSRKSITSYFKKVVNKSEYHVTMEATGVYHRILFATLVTLEFDCSVVNPYRIKKFSEMKMIRAKTDSVDAKIIAEYGCEQKPILSTLPSKCQMEIITIFKAMESYQKLVTSLRNQMLALRSCESEVTLVIKAYQKTIKDNRIIIRKFEDRIKEIVLANYEEVYKRLLEIPGIGPKNSSLILGYFGKFEGFDSVKQVVSFVGINPHPKTSGTSVRGRSNISKRGNPVFRKMLYLAALSAKRYNPDCILYYESLLARGMKKKKALIAVAHKLLRQVFAVVKYDRTWVRDYRKNCLTLT